VLRSPGDHVVAGHAADDDPVRERPRERAGHLPAGPLHKQQRGRAHCQRGRDVRPGRDAHRRVQPHQLLRPARRSGGRSGLQPAPAAARRQGPLSRPSPLPPQRRGRGRQRVLRAQPGASPRTAVHSPAESEPAGLAFAPAAVHPQVRAPGSPDSTMSGWRLSRPRPAGRVPAAHACAQQAGPRTSGSTAPWRAC